jgi:serine/threonine-protein kinase HipA
MANRRAEVRLHGILAGWLVQDDEGYHFWYSPDYLQSASPQAISLTLPLRSEAYHSKVMIAFFDGLIPEGWLLEIAQRNWKLNSRDRMGLLMACCGDCIGAVTIHPLPGEGV